MHTASISDIYYEMYVYTENLKKKVYKPDPIYFLD